MQEGDVQIKGYPVRLPLDLAIVFSANPEDYTARGKIVTPLKDRIGSEIRTHYPETIDEGIAITAQEAWTSRTAKNGTRRIEVPHYVRQIVEQIAFTAREDKKVDKRSGVSQRLHARVRQRKPLALLARHQQKRAHRRRLADAEGHHIVLDVLHRVVDRQRRRRFIPRRRPPVPCRRWR
jgi:Mg-chelatase subunit ChlI